MNRSTVPHKKPRARDLGIPFTGMPGPDNAITDVAGVRVGHCTLLDDARCVRTGVTAVLPPMQQPHGLFAAWHALNGNGEMTGTTWIDESGYLEGPVLLTNTHSVGVVRDAVVAWMHEQAAMNLRWALPVVAETYDGYLNDINGFHVRAEHAFAALNDAQSGPVAEGNVGGGTGMICYQYKGGIGTASRQVASPAGLHTLGVLVQANYGKREHLRIAGVAVGEILLDDLPQAGSENSGSIIVVIATDAPLLPHQLKRLCRRVPLGMGRLGAIAANSSGDIFLAFSTANAGLSETPLMTLSALSNEGMDGLFEACIQATEEAIINAMVAAETLNGVRGNKVHALPHQALRDMMKDIRR